MKTFIEKFAPAALCLSLILPMTALAEKCPKCREMMYTTDVGTCDGCGGGTASGAFELCRKCSEEKNRCEACNVELGADKAKEGGAGQEKPVAEPAVRELLAAPAEITIDGKKLSLGAYLWRDFMPSVGGAKKGLLGSIKLNSADKSEFPDGLTVEKVWLVKGKELWSPAAFEVRKPDGNPPALEVVVRNGPAWEPGIKVHVVVRVKGADGKTLLLKAADQEISKTS